VTEIGPFPRTRTGMPQGHCVLSAARIPFRQEGTIEKVAHREGLEPPTCGFGVRYSAIELPVQRRVGRILRPLS
jgi:hypothetical protein